MMVRVVRSRHKAKEWQVEIQQGVQSFRLDYSNPDRRETAWYAQMFRKALSAYKLDWDRLEERHGKEATR